MPGKHKKAYIISIRHNKRTGYIISAKDMVTYFMRFFDDRIFSQKGKIFRRCEQ